MKPEHKRLLLISIFPLLVLSITAVSIFQKKSFYPADDVITAITSDRNKGGFSEVEIVEENSGGITWTYKLNPGYIYPYAGITFYSRHLLTRATFNRLDINIRAEGTSSLRLIVESEIPGYSHPSNGESYLIRQADLKLDPDMGTYRIGFDDFTVPFWWWIGRDDLTEADLPRGFRHIKSIRFENGELSSDTEQAVISVQQMTFARKPLPLLLAALSILSLYFLLLIFLTLRKRTVRYSARLISECESLSDNFPDERLRLLITYLSDQYKNPEINVSKACRDLNCSVSWLYKKLMANFGIPLKTYISILRITEAKRLLGSTNLPISEMSEKLGYTNRKTFNRQFHASAGMSPSAYRQQVFTGTGQPV